MSRILATGFSVLVSVMALLGVGAASAAPAPSPRPVFPPDSFEVAGTDGYTISVTAFPDFPNPRPGRGFVSVTVRRGDESAAYGKQAKVTEDSMRADFGDLGRVDLVLRRTGADAQLDYPCLRTPDFYEAGTWEGVFEFEGEGGYTRAEATEAPALPSIGTVPKAEACGGESSGESRGPNLPGARLAGLSFADGRILKYQFNKNRPGGKTVFAASLAERREGIRIYRKISGVDPASAFRYAADVRSARLTPPAPFSGTASATRDPNSVSPSILGSLRLSFPGRRSVRLTGPSFHVSLNHARLEHGEDGSISIGF